MGLLGGRLFGFIVWILFCILIGKCADRWNRSFVKYLVLSIIFSPVIMGIILLIMGKREYSGGSATSSSAASGPYYGAPSSNSGPTWICRKCGDKNPANSSFCKGCGEYKPTGVVISNNKNSIPLVINAGDEWICRECDTVNPLTASNCKSCGAYK